MNRPPVTPTLPVKHYALISDCPNFHRSGSITGMRKFYGKFAQLVRCGSYIYNVERSPNRDKILSKAKYRCRPCQ